MPATGRPEPTLTERLDAFAAALGAMGAIRSPSVERAFRTVARHRCLDGFHGPDGHWVAVSTDGPVPAGILDAVYADTALVTRLSDAGAPVSSSSQPSLVARMLEELRLAPGTRVLEVGAGTGYNAALIAVVTGSRVATVDASAEVAAGARAALGRLGLGELVVVTHGDGYSGQPALAPFDRIVVTCGCTGVSPEWLAQLAPDGFALVPLTHGGCDPVVVVRVGDDGRVRGRMLTWAGFMPASGPLGEARPGQARVDPGLPERGPEPSTLRLTGALGWEDYSGLWCFCATRDERVTRAAMPGLDPAFGTCALHDPDRGTVWLHADGVARATGDRGLLVDASGLVRSWERLGRPVDAWRFEFELTGTRSRPVWVPDRDSWSATAG